MADTMFEELGYHTYCNDKMSLEYAKMEEGIEEYICFSKCKHEVHKQWCMEWGSITMQELKAINEKVKELGWFND